ncbi:MAG: NAD-dependent epimerase/dehydratase family protein [Phormidesmis sp. CAN_BIN44]|nr:NAD-dependent epimerase/dehydratase family protein [Phormidesmis sp. CAN_BIN44]
MSKAFVTGGTGFVGANLVRLLLKEGYQVRALVRQDSRLDNLDGLDVELVKGDLTDPDLARQMTGCEVLFHVAAHYSLWQTDRDRLYQANVIGTRNILASARQAGIERSVYTSSVAAIGVGEHNQPVDETHQSPVETLVGHYKKSKYWAEQEAVKAAQVGQDIVIVNPSTPIGAWDLKPTPTGEDIILRMLRRKMPAYVETGLNFIHVEDVAQGHLLALKKGKSGDRYILGHQNLTLKQLLDQLSQLTGLPAPSRSIPAWIPLSVAWVGERILAPLGKTPTVSIDGVRMSQHAMYYDATKAVRDLGLPQTPIHTALKDAVDWFVSNGYVN